MKKVGFFGGTFDPIHFGHIHLAIQLSEMHRLDEVLFCPAFCSPFKTKSPPRAEAKHRMAMLRLGIEGIPNFHVTELELDRRQPSYTIDTLRFLQQKRANHVQFHLLLSDEAARHLDQWKDFRELITLAPPLIGVRDSLVIEGDWANALQKGMTSTPMFPISSTQIRERLEKGLYCGHLIPSKTLDYIQENNLYTQTA